MQTQPNYGYFKNNSSHSLLLDTDFIAYINTLNDSIKEFCKVSKNANKNKRMLINLSELEVNNAENILNEMNKNEVKNNSKIYLMNIIDQLKDILLKFQTNFISEENNLQNFFEDVKVLFKNMKEKRKELIVNIKNSSSSTTNRRNLSIYAPSQSNANVPLKKENILGNKCNASEFNFNIQNINNSLSNFCQRLDNGNKTVRHNKTMNINYGNDRKSKTVNKTVSFNDEFMNSLENNSNSESNLGKKNSMKRSIDVKSQNLEIQNKKR